MGRERPISKFLKWFGAIAQLGERLHGMQEVGGSIPPGSTISDLISDKWIAGLALIGAGPVRAEKAFIEPKL